MALGNIAGDLGVTHQLPASSYTASIHMGVEGRPVLAQA
jgi:hypothetical protein